MVLVDNRSDVVVYGSDNREAVGAGENNLGCEAGLLGVGDAAVRMYWELIQEQGNPLQSFVHMQFYYPSLHMI